MSSAKSDKFSAARLGSLLQAEIADPLAASYCVALSGGADSVALLAAMVELRSGSTRFALRALHVDHGLDRGSAHWAQQAQATAQKLGVECIVERVRVAVGGGASVEAAARDARYAVLRAALAREEFLLTAHHVDDQLETVLLQLARGAGVAGLAAMPAHAPFGRGRHLRPLLGVSHGALLQYATEQGLSWTDDPMNADVRFDRGFLRASVLPALRKRWPSIAANTARSARHMAEAQRLLDSVAERDWMRARDGARLEVAGLAGLEPGRAANLLRFWIRRSGQNLPSAQNLDRLMSMMTEAARDSTPCVRWPGTAVRRYRGRLYIAHADELPALGEQEWNWPTRRSLLLGAGLGSLSMTAGPGPAALAQDRLPKVLALRPGAGGESLRPSAGARQRALRNLLQESGVVPWLRKSIPHLYAGRELVAVGNLWSDARFQPSDGESAIHVEWRDGPELF